MESVLYTAMPSLYKTPMKSANSVRFTVMTFLILSGLASCARLSPPVSRGLSKGVSRPAGQIGVSLLQEGLKIGFKGVDAGRMYLLMAILGETATGDESTSFTKRVKSGRDFQCSAVVDDFICELTVTTSGGVLPVRDPAKVVKAAPEMEQKEYKDEWITVSPPDQPGKMKLGWSGAPAKGVFEALSIPAVSGRKTGEKIECSERAGAAATDQKSYECVVALDLQTGSVDRPGTAAETDLE